VAQVVLILLFLLFATVLVPVLYYLAWREDFEGIRSRWHYANDLPFREPLSPAAFYERYYLCSGIPEDFVVRFLRFQSDYWKVDPARVLPEDDYLAMNSGLDFFADYVAAIRREFGVELREEDADDAPQTEEGSQSPGAFDLLLRLIARKAGVWKVPDEAAFHLWAARGDDRVHVSGTDVRPPEPT
jgi:hypothetical protein